MSRLEQIEKLLAADPDDAFLNFSLAMEYQSADRTDDALKQYDRTIQADPAYLAAYMRKSEMLMASHRFDEARPALTQAIEVARKAGDNHMVEKIVETQSHLPRE